MKWTKEKFIKEATERFGNKFDYSNIEWKGRNTTINIICKKHGVIKITPKVHLNSVYGCKQCFIDTKAKAISLSFQEIFNEETNYRKEYIELINKAKRRNSNVGEIHHILPKSMFPLWKNKSSNLVTLSCKEHYIAHFLLYKIYGSKEMVNAFFLMLRTTKGKYNPDLYEEVRRKQKELSCKKVYCYETGKTFNSIKEASKSVKLKHLTILAEACRNFQFSRGGCHWCYLEDREKAIQYWETHDIYSNVHNKAVYCFEKNKDYINQITAAKENKIQQSIHILECCRDWNRTANNLHFCRLEDKEKAVQYWKTTNLKYGFNRSVYCYELDRVFFNHTEAIKTVGLKSVSSICSCCKDWNKLGKDYHWCFLEDKEKAIQYWKTHPMKVHKVKVYCLEKDKQYNSFKEAAQDIGLKNSSPIQFVCKNWNKTSKGFHFCRLEDKEKAIQFWNK